MTISSRKTTRNSASFGAFFVAFQLSPGREREREIEREGSLQHCCIQADRGREREGETACCACSVEMINLAAETNEK